MVVSRQLGPALFAAAALLSFIASVDATSSSNPFAFDSCVENCIYGGGCATTDGKCMCKAAKGKLLDTVAICMYNNCPSEIRTFDASFINPIVAGCKAIGKPIPQTNVDNAEDTAAVFAAKLPSTSTTPKATQPKTTTSPSPSKKQTTAAPTTSASESVETETGSTSSEDDDSSTTAAATTTTTPDSTPETTVAVATTSQTSTSTTSAGRQEATDSNPFATPPDSSAPRGMTSWLWAALPLALAAVVLR